MKRVLVVCGALACSGCFLLHASMERQIAIATGCSDVKVVEQHGNDARVDVCGDVRACRWVDETSSWVCAEPAE